MKRLRVGLGLVVLLAALASAAPASASIHPIVASFCASANASPTRLDPPGQTPTSPDPNDWKVSTLRALQATGFLTLIRDANGNVIGFTIDDTVQAVKDGNFPAFTHCPNLSP
jgi:hypothetical protein